MLEYLKNNKLKATVFFLAALRLAVDAWLPLLDKTEARYAEIARIMYETGNWVTPQIDYGVPFWAKPPMSTWISALSFHVFGVNEFAARFPSFLIHILLIVFIAKALRLTTKYAYLLAFFLLTIPEYYIHSGVVSTDSSLLVGITFIMIGYWNSIQTNTHATLWKLITWIGVTIGMLSKGPIVLVLTIPPLFIWSCLYKGKLVMFFKKAFWLPGLLLAFVVSFSWYYMAEIRTPGFIDYFFVGEHYKRFVESGWKGDKYGFAKQQPKGMIWVFLALFSLPWIQFAVTKFVQQKEELVKNKWVTFLWLWLLFPVLFFTVSKSLIHTYTLPCTVPLGLLVLHYYKSYTAHKPWVIGALVVPVVLFFGFIGLNTVYTDVSWQASDKHLVEIAAENKVDIYIWQRKTYSSQFYTKGKIKMIHTAQEVAELINTKEPFYILSRNSSFKNFPEHLKSQFKKEGKSAKTSLYLYDK